MKKIALNACLAMSLQLGFVACEGKSIVGEPPVYSNLKFTTASPSTISLDNQATVPTSSRCTAGDSVTVFMQVGYTGAYIYHASYEWKLTSGEVQQDTVIAVVAPLKKAVPPMWTFKAPEYSGRYTVSFKAKYKYSADTALGTIYGESNSYNANLTVE